MPAISAKTALWISPNTTDTVHTSADGVPTVAAIEPIEVRTRAGTPLAIQNAPVQLSDRWSPGSSGRVVRSSCRGTTRSAVSAMQGLLVEQFRRREIPDREDCNLGRAQPPAPP